MRRWLSRYGPVTLMVLSIALAVAPQAAAGDWWMVTILTILAAYVVTVSIGAERSRVSWYRAGYARGVVVAFEEAHAALAGRRLARGPAAIADVHPDDGWRP